MGDVFNGHSLYLSCIDSRLPQSSIVQTTLLLIFLNEHGGLIGFQLGIYFHDTSSVINIKFDQIDKVKIAIHLKLTYNLLLT